MTIQLDPPSLYGPDGRPVNGHPVASRTAETWTPIRTEGIATTWEKQAQAATPAPRPAAPASVAPVVDPVAAAEAEAIRKRAEAEVEATRIKAVEEARKLKLANDKAEAKAREEEAVREARIAAARRRQAEEERRAADDQKQAAIAKQRAAEERVKVERSSDSWRKAAIGFAIVCGVVALPVQMHAFYNRRELWLLAAPLMLEGGAWVVNRGARAAVDEHRPHWHYRAISWALAGISAGINFSHGITHFDIATAIGTAFASVAGPGVWDLHEHGRIRKRDGVLTRREHKAKEKAAKQLAAEKRAREEKAAADKEAADKARKAAVEKLAAARAEQFPKVWEHAVKLAAALGETTVTEAVWRRAHRDIEGTDPGESVDIIAGRRKAEKRVESARTGSPVGGGTVQRASQMPGAARRRIYTPPAAPGIRRKGDTPRYVQAARKQASITARNATDNQQKEG